MSDDPTEVIVKGTIEAVFFASPKFSAGRLRIDGATQATFAGPVMVQCHDNVVMHGVWHTHPKFGRQLKVRSFELDQKPSSAGLAHYLANHPALKGLGPVKAKRIVDAFGDDFDRVIDEEPDLVRQVGKISKGTVDVLREDWLRTRALNASLTWLSSFDLTHRQMTRLITRYGNSVVSVLKEDPYLLVREIPGFGFKRVDLVARKLGTAKEHPGRLRAGIVHCVLERIDQGDCWVDYESLVELANGLLVMDVPDSRARIEHALDELVADETLACAAIGGRFLVARPDLLEQERDIAEVFMTKLGRNPHFDVDGSRGSLVLDERLNEAQRGAVQAALEHSIVVISGPAGSGKSFVVGTISKLYEALGRRVVLAAPTGKAAKRLEQVVQRGASTLHRLLGYNGKKFCRGMDDPIDADILIVDEVSMVDTSLAWYLLRAIDFARTCLVLVGDHNQLPPVGPGNLLRDLIERQPVPVILLNQVVRQAGVLQESSLAILRGQVRPTAPAELDGTRPWNIASGFTEVADVQRYLLELYEGVLSDKLGFDLVKDVQLLTPTWKGPLGVDELNVALQRLVQRKCWGVDVPARSERRQARPLLYDRVIQARNNYELGVMNGSIGTVVDVHDGRGEMRVRFDDDEILYTREAAAELRLAYALTVHKAQGAEMPCVVVVVHKSHAYQHHRNLFYTSVTRARRVAIVVGDRWGIQHCAEVEQVERRKTFLSVMELRRFGGMG